jgi:hypothetical protein
VVDPVPVSSFKETPTGSRDMIGAIMGLLSLLLALVLGILVGSAP